MSVEGSKLVKDKLRVSVSEKSSSTLSTWPLGVAAEMIINKSENLLGAYYAINLTLAVQ